MKRVLAITLLLALALLAGCSSGADLSKAKTQEDFGLRMARMNLWREALFRFQRAVEIDPTDAEARNNLAVAYEANGEFEAALREYREAMRLDRSNQYIQKNYSRFVEFTQRNRRRQRPETPRTTATAATPASLPMEPAAPPAAPPAEEDEPDEPKAPPDPPAPPDGGSR